MKVICIDASDKGIGKPPFSEGEILSATQSHHPDDYYILEYKEFNGVCGWQKSRFIPLSEIDEMELTKQRELQLIL